MADIPDNVDLMWIARKLVVMEHGLQSLRDDVTVVAAVVNRIDNNQSSFVEELRALRTQQAHLRRRVEILEAEDN
jgi:regulator of replication initiation timing